MRTARCCLLLLLLILLLAPKPGWSAKEAGGPAQEAAAGGEKATGEEELGRGEGFETKAEEAKGVECPATFGPIITDTAVPIDKGKFAIQPTFGYGFVVNTLTPNWRRETAGGNFQSFGMTWKLSYGPMDNLETFIELPFQYNWAWKVNDPGPNGNTSANAGGFGDLNLVFKYRLVEETEQLPTVTALFGTTFPTGKFKTVNPTNLGQDVTGGGAFVFTTGFNLSKCYNPFVVYGTFWYSMQTAFTDDTARLYPRDYVTVNLAAEYVITPKWVALLEFTSFWDGGRLFGHQSNVSPAALTSIIPGIEYMATDKLAFALGCQVDLFGKNVDAAVTPLFSFVYSF